MKGVVDVDELVALEVDVEVSIGSYHFVVETEDVAPFVGGFVDLHGSDVEFHIPRSAIAPVLDRKPITVVRVRSNGNGIQRHRWISGLTILWKYRLGIATEAWLAPDVDALHEEQPVPGLDACETAQMLIPEVEGAFDDGPGLGADG